jgi:hypothetical protein
LLAIEPELIANDLRPAYQYDIFTFMSVLNETEKIIIEALGNDTLTVEELAIKSGYEVSGYFRNILTSLCKRGILANKRPGYYLKSEFHYLLKDSIEH